MIQRCYRWFHTLIHHPIQVFWICAALMGIGVLLDGTAFRLWSLHRENYLMTGRIAAARLRSNQLEEKIRRAQQPAFIEKTVRDQFDLVKEGDLVFIFSDDTTL